MVSPNMTRHPPPLVIHGARVVSYAFVDDIAYRESGALYSGDKLVEHVPRLAICINLGENIGPMLFHCDEQWNVLGTSGADSVEQVKDRAENNYPGVASRWVDTNVTVADALRYYDHVDGRKCSFCGKRAFEVDAWIERDHAIICKTCVETIFNELSTE
jgi:ClpX C4-type zinc finger